MKLKEMIKMFGNARNLVEVVETVMDHYASLEEQNHLLRCELVAREQDLVNSEAHIAERREAVERLVKTVRSLQSQLASGAWADPSFKREFIQ